MVLPRIDGDAKREEDIKTTAPIIKKDTCYPKEFREEVVRYWLSSGQQAKVVAAEVRVSDWSVNRWRQVVRSMLRVYVGLVSCGNHCLSIRFWIFRSSIAPCSMMRP